MSDLTDFVRHSSTNFKGFSVGVSAEGSASNEVLSAKQRFAARAAQWKVLRNRIMWAMRGVPNPDMGSTEGELQNVMGDLVQVTSVNAPMRFTFGNMRVSAFHARGGSKSTPIADQFDIVRNCMSHIFQYGIQPNSSEGAACLALPQPVLAAFEKATTSFSCAHLAKLRYLCRKIHAGGLARHH